MWLKIWRDSSAMAGRPHYMEFNNINEIESLLDYYEDEIERDCHDGYHDLNHEIIDKPPKEWIKKQIDRYTEISKNLFSNYRRNKIDVSIHLMNLKNLYKTY